MLECVNSQFARFNGSRLGKLPHKKTRKAHTSHTHRKRRKNTIFSENEEKTTKTLEIVEILINYAEEIIDIATELQYLLIERLAIKNDKRDDINSKQESILSENVSVLQKRGGAEKWTQNKQEEESASISMQKLYVPVFRLSAHNEETKNKN